MEEKVFFDQRGVTVTNARFIVNGQTYAMNGVTSVKGQVAEPNRAGPVIVGLLAFVSINEKAWLITLILIAIMVFWWRSQKAVSTVILNSASGENKALSSKDGDFIRTVINALNDSIIYRG